jgi:hypothetical protein
MPGLFTRANRPTANELHLFQAGGFTMRSAELLDCKSLEPGALIDVETTSRHYQIECLGGSMVRVSGHPRFCPTPVVAQLEGSVTSEGTIEEGIIERGMRLVLLFDDHIPVTTSKVLHVQWDRTN